MKQKKSYRELARTARKQITKNNKNSVPVPLSRVAFKITANTGNDLRIIENNYRELHELLEEESYLLIADWIKGLFATRGSLKKDLIKWENASTFSDDNEKDQVREEILDTSHAKNLRFTKEGDEDEIPLNNPLIFYKRPNGTKKLLIGFHRLYKCKKVLKVSQVPCVEISPSLVTQVGEEAIVNFGRIDNSVQSAIKQSALSDDGATVLSMFKSWLLTQPECGKLTQEEKDDFLNKVLKHPFTCRDEFPAYWQKIYKIAKIASVAHGPKKIREQVFRAHDKGFSPYLNGRIDQVKESLKANFEEVREPGEKSSNTFEEKSNKTRFSIVLCDGGQQQEQAFLKRVLGKRLQNPESVIYGIIAGAGNSKSAILQCKISFLNLFLPSIKLNGFEATKIWIENVYKDGFMVYPQFTEGLSNLEITCGKKKYLVSCDKEDAKDMNDWNFIPVEQVLDFLKGYTDAHPTEWEISEMTDELWNIISPKNGVFSLKTVARSEIKHEKK